MGWRPWGGVVCVDCARACGWARKVARKRARLEGVRGEVGGSAMGGEMV